MAFLGFCLSCVSSLLSFVWFFSVLVKTMDAHHVPWCDFHMFSTCIVLWFSSTFFLLMAPNCISSFFLLNSFNYLKSLFLWRHFFPFLRCAFRCFYVSFSLFFRGSVPLSLVGDFFFRLARRDSGALLVFFFLLWPCCLNSPLVKMMCVHHALWYLFVFTVCVIFCIFGLVFST